MWQTLQVGVLPREGLQWKARSAARTWNVKPDPKGHAQNKKSGKKERRIRAADNQALNFTR
ncbi:hypothetical protein [Mucilaginibacter sp.]|uniref:hypothetical protein n=1 Tax=Mucilaginibacter sp. TaxID=1882438 RepID=UPI003B0099D0